MFYFFLWFLYDITQQRNFSLGDDFISVMERVRRMFHFIAIKKFAMNEV